MIKLLFNLKAFVFAALLGTLLLGTAVETSALTRCGSGSECASGSCQRVSQGVYFDCNPLGKVFGCKNDSGGCALFCTREVLNKLACMRSCTRNADCDTGDRCRQGACRKTPE